MNWEDCEAAIYRDDWHASEMTGINPYELFVGSDELADELFPDESHPMFIDYGQLSGQLQITQDGSKKIQDVIADQAEIQAENISESVGEQKGGAESSVSVSIQWSGREQLSVGQKNRNKGFKQQQLEEELGMQYEQEGSQIKKEETVATSELKLPTLYEQELNRYRYQIEQVCARQKTQFTKFLSKKRCNQTKIVCKLLRNLLHGLKSPKQENLELFYEDIEAQLAKMSQINDIRLLLADQKNTQFRNTLKYYLVSPELLLPIITNLSKKDYLKYLLLYSLDVLHMMVDDPYRTYSTWILSREIAKGDYSELIETIQRGQKLSLEYVRDYVDLVFEQRGRELLLNRKCSDTNNTCYFIVTFFIKFLKSTYETMLEKNLKKEESLQPDPTLPTIQSFEKCIILLDGRKSFYSMKGLVNNRSIRTYIRKNFLESNRFILAVLTYDRITSLTVKNIMDKYTEILEMFQ